VKWTRRHPARTISLLSMAAAMLAFAFGSIFLLRYHKRTHCTIGNAVKSSRWRDIRLRQEAYHESVGAGLMHSVERIGIACSHMCSHARLPGFREKDVRGFECTTCGTQALRNPRVLRAASRMGRWSNSPRTANWCAFDRPQCHPQIWDTRVPAACLRAIRLAGHSSLTHFFGAGRHTLVVLGVRPNRGWQRPFGIQALGRAHRKAPVRRPA